MSRRPRKEAGGVQVRERRRKWGRGRLRLLRSRGWDWESPCVGRGVVAMIAPLFVCHLFFLRPLSHYCSAESSLRQGRQRRRLHAMPCRAACRSLFLLSAAAARSSV